MHRCITDGRFIFIPAISDLFASGDLLRIYRHASVHFNFHLEEKLDRGVFWRVLLHRSFLPGRQENKTAISFAFTVTICIFLLPSWYSMTDDRVVLFEHGEEVKQIAFSRFFLQR
jgi:hypothetical protein